MSYVVAWRRGLAVGYIQAIAVNQDPSLDDSKLSKDIIWGFQIFTDTPGQVPHLAPGKMTCNNCHLNGGQRERSLPLVGIAGMFPEYNKRAGRLYTLADRVVDCFNRSENATSAGVNERGMVCNSLPLSISRIRTSLDWIESVDTARSLPLGLTLKMRGSFTIGNLSNNLPVATSPIMDSQI